MYLCEKQVLAAWLDCLLFDDHFLLRDFELYGIIFVKAFESYGIR